MSEEERKKLYLWMFLAILVGGGGSTGVNMLTTARHDAWTATQAKEAHEEMKQHYMDRFGAIYKTANDQAAAIRNLQRDTYTKDQIRERLKDLQHMVETNNSACAARAERIEAVDVRMTDDIRNIYTLVASLDAEHPPPELQAAVAANRLGLAELNLRLTHLEKELNE